MARYYIVEHPTRGTYIDRELEPGIEVKWKYRFSWKGLRTDENVCKFVSEAKAAQIANAVKGAYVLQVETRPTLKITKVSLNRVGGKVGS